MAQTILLKRSATPGKVPLTTDLALGEIGINTYDGKMYFEKDNGTVSIVQVGTVTSVGGTGTVSGLTLTGTVTGSGSLTLGGTLALVNGDIPATLTGKTYNGLTLTAAATGFTIAGGTTSKTLTVSNTLTLTGTDASSIAFGAGGTVAYTSNNLSAFATTTSAQLAGVISDETGSGSLVFATSPTLVTPNIGVATGTSFNSITGLSSTTPLINGTAAVGTGTTVARADHVHPSDTSKLSLTGGTVVGDLTLSHASPSIYFYETDAAVDTKRWLLVADGSSFQLQIRTDANVYVGNVMTITRAGNATFSGTVTADSFNSITGLSSTTPSALGTAAVGTGVTVARADHVHAMPTLDALSNTTITTIASGEILKWNGTAWVNNTLAEAGIQAAGSYQPLDADLTSWAGVTRAAGIDTFVTTPTSAKLAAAVTDETGSGALVFATSPTLVTPVLGVATGTSFNSITGLSSTSPVMSGTATVGTGTTVARADHVHPSDTSKLSLSGGTMTGSIVIPTGQHITVTDAPVNGTDAVNKNYVDANLAGLSWKDSVRIATTTNITLSGLQTIDGLAVTAGMRVLVKDQTTASQNGIYVASATAWTRADDMDATTPINELNSAAVFVEGGSTQQDTGWTQINAVTTLGTDAITFTQFNGAAGITAGVGLTKTGNQLDISLGAGIAQLPTDEVGIDVYATGGLMTTVDGTASSTLTGAQLSLTKVGTAGTYKSVTTDAYGRVTAGTNPTTLAGYGITDASLNTHTHILDGLSDVTITTNTADEILKWTGTAWVNNTLAEAGIQAAGSYQPLDADLTSWAGVTRAAGFDTFVTTPSSANLATLVTDQTGTGTLVFATSPTLVTPNIGVATGTSFNSITGLSSTTPLINGTAAVGTSTTTARADHVHPTDTTRAQDSLVVHLAGTETITGFKTFSTGPLVSAADMSIRATIQNTSSTAARWPGLGIINYSGTFPTGFPVIELQSARGTSAAPTAVQSGDILGGVNGWGWNGTAMDDVCRIQFVAASNFNGTTDDGNIEFWTQSGTTLTKRMQITSQGAIDFLPGPITGYFYMGNIGANPYINFDANDYLSYDRTANAFNFVIGGTNELSLTSSGATFGGTITSNAVTATGLSSFINGTATGSAEIAEFRGTDYGVGNPYLFIKHGTVANEYFIGLWDGVSTAGVINFGSQISARKGIQLGTTVYPTYEINLDFGADVANTWRKIIGITCANTGYSTHGFIVEIFDPQANHAPLSTVGAVIHETYYVACTYSNDTVIGTPDSCAVSGPGSRVRAIKTAAGVYEVQVQNLTQYRECKIRIHSYAANSSHTINYFDGAAAGTAIATYNAAVSASTDVFQEVDVRGTSASTSTTTGALVVSGGVGIAGDTYVGGHISIPDNKNLYVGTGNDLYANHDGSNTAIVNQTGNLTITNTTVGSGLVLRSENNSGSNFELWGGAAYLDATTSYFRSQDGATTNAYINNTGLTSQNNTDWPLRTLTTSATVTSRGGTLQQRSISGGAVTTNTILGGLSTGGHNGTSLTSGWNGGAELLFTATENWTSIANGTKFAVNLSANGATTPTARLTIDQDGSTTVNGALTVAGNLTVNGTTTTINATTLTVDDKNIELGSVTTPTNTTADGGGITLKGTTDKTIIWDNAGNNWTSSEHWNLVTGRAFKINNVDVLTATTLGSSVTASSLTSVGTITSGTWNAGAVTSSGVVTGTSLDTTYGRTTSGTLTTTAVTQVEVPLSLAATTYRTVEYLVQATSGTTYHTSKVHVIHDGTNTWVDEYSTMFTSASLYTVTADISGGNIRLLVTPASATSTTFKVIATAIDV